MKNKTVSVIYLVFSFLSLSYFIVLLTENFQLLTFSSIWFLFAALLLYISLRIRNRGKDKKYHFMEGSRKSLKLCSIIFLAAAAVVSAFNLTLILNPVIDDGKEDVSYLIVLGGGIKNDGTLADVPSRRIEKAFEYLEQHPSTKVIVSGGKGLVSKYAEGPELARVLVEKGISEERIFVEDQALDTIDNLTFSAALIARNENISLDEVLDQGVTVVTSDFHLRRSEILAHRLGYSKVYGIASQTPAKNILNCYCREICSYIKLCARILLTGKPSKLS